MPFTVSGLAAHVDETRDELLTKAIASSRSKSLGTMHTGVKGTQDIHFLSNGLVYQADACELTASGNTDLTKVPITVAAMAIQLKYCQKDLIGKYTQRWLRDGSNGELDEIFIYQNIGDELAKQIASQEETNIWRGDTGGSGNLAFYDGWIKKINAASALTINGNPSGITAATGLTAANAISIMQGMYLGLPAALLGKDNLAITLGMDDFRIYQQALVNANLFHYNGDTLDTILLPGTSVPIQGLNGLNGTNRIFAGIWDNLHWGTDLESDEEEFIVESGNRPGDKNFYVTVRFKTGTAITFPDQIVQFTLVP